MKNKTSFLPYFVLWLPSKIRALKFSRGGRNEYAADAAGFTLSQEHIYMKITNHPSYEYAASSNQPIPPLRDRCVISAAAAA